MDGESPREDPPPSKKKPAAVFLTAYLLWLVLGPFGAHRFYLRKRTSANLYLGTFGIFGLGWAADALLTAFMARDYVRGGGGGADSLPDAAFPSGTAVSGAPASGPLASILHGILLLLSSASLLGLLVYFDYALLCLPLALAWLLLLSGRDAASAFGRNAQLFRDIPFNGEHAVAAAEYDALQSSKGFRTSAAKYLVFPLYAAAYPFLARRMDRRGMEGREFASFLRMHSGVLLFSALIFTARLVGGALAAGQPWEASLSRLHPLGLVAGILLGEGGAARYPFLVASYALLLGAVAYFSQIQAAVMARGNQEYRERRGASFAWALKGTGFAVAAFFLIVGSGAALFPGFRERVSLASPLRLREAVDFAYGEGALRALLDDHVLSGENASIVYDLLEGGIALSGEGGREYSRSERWRAVGSAYAKAFLFDVEKIAGRRYAPYYSFYPILFDDRSGLRHCYFVYSIDGIASSSFLPGERRIWPLIILEAERNEGGQSEGISISARLPDGFSYGESAKAGTDAAGAEGAGTRRLEADIGDKLFQSELKEGFRRYFIDSGRGPDSFEIDFSRFLAGRSRS